MNLRKRVKMEDKLKRKILKYIEKNDPSHEIVTIDEVNKKINYSDKIVCHNPIKFENEGYVRAYLVVKLITEMKYPIECIELEKHYNIGSKPKDKNAFIDIIVRDKKISENVFLFIECKAPETYESNKVKIETQLFNMAAIQNQEGKVSYLVYYGLEENRIHEKMYVIDYVETPSYKKWMRTNPLDDSFGIPSNYGMIQHAYYANVSDENEEYKPLDMELEKNDFIKLQNKLHNVLWGGGSTSYNDIFFYLMHIFLAKIYDELWCLEGDKYAFQFMYEYDEKSKKTVLESSESTFSRLEKKYKEAQQSLLNMPADIIAKSNFIDLDKVEMSKIMGVVHILEGISITKNKNQSDLLGDFFESIIENEFKQSKGQFFTHKNIVRFIIEAIGIKNVALERITTQKSPDTLLPYIIDPSCGSGTFLLESMKAISEYYLEKRNEIKVAKPIKKVLEKQLFIEDEDDKNQINTWANRFIYGIESNAELTTATKVNMILHGDGNANVFNKNGLHNFDVYHDPARIIQGFENKLNNSKKVRFCNQDYFLNEEFDFVITNPPFSLTFGDGEYANDYKNRFLFSDKKNSENLFIERWYQLLKEGGRLAAVLPDSVFDTTENKYIRLFIYRFFNVKAIVSLPKSTFEPYTSTKTSILFAQKKKAEDVALWDKKWEEVSKAYQYKKTRVENIVSVHDGFKKKEKPTSIKNMTEKEEHALICEFLKDFLVKKDKELDLASLIEKYRLELRDLCSYDKDTVEAFGYVNTWWVFNEVSRCFDYEVFMTEVDNIGYKRTKRGEKETQNDLYSLEYAPEILDFESIQEWYKNNINEVKKLIQKEKSKLGKEKDDKKINSINKKIQNAVDKENKLEEDLKKLETFVEKYYDKSYKIKEEYAERTDKELIDMFRIGLLKKYKSQKIALRDTSLLTILDYLRKLNWD